MRVHAVRFIADFKCVGSRSYNEGFPYSMMFNVSLIIRACQWPLAPSFVPSSIHSFSKLGIDHLRGVCLHFLRPHLRSLLAAVGPIPTGSSKRWRLVQSLS